MSEQPHLHKTLTPLKLWALMVGMVISGQYFGWSYGIGLVHSLGNYFYAVVLVVVFYIALTLSCAELASFIPLAGGPSAYARRAFGKSAGVIAGFACLLEFICAVPAIAVSLGGYVHILLPMLSAKIITLLAILLVLAVNSFKVENMATIELFATLLALIGLAIYYAFGLHTIAQLPSQTMSFAIHPHEILLAIPFSIWLFLAIEGGVMGAEEMRDPKRTIIIGFVAALTTLVVCTVLTVGITAKLSGHLAASTDSPLPAALLRYSGYLNTIAARLIVIFGFFGLFASMNGITMAYSRQVYALSRAGVLPAFLSRLNASDVPLWALIIPGFLVIILALCASIGEFLVTLSVLGAVLMYLIIFISLIKLRRSEPKTQRPFKVVMPLAVLGIGLAVIFLLAIVYGLVLQV